MSTCPNLYHIFCFSLVAVFIPKFFSLACGPLAFLCKVNCLQLMRLVFCQPIKKKKKLVSQVLLSAYHSSNGMIVLLILMDFILNCASTLLNCYVLLWYTKLYAYGHAHSSTLLQIKVCNHNCLIWVYLISLTSHFNYFILHRALLLLRPLIIL